MPEKLTDYSVPLVVAIFMSIETFLIGIPDMFGISNGAVLTAIGGAYWAVFRHQTLRVHKSVFMILFSAIIACIMVHGIEWILAWIGAPKIDQRPVTFLLGFAVIDKPTRSLIVNIFKQKIGYTER